MTIQVDCPKCGKVYQVGEDKAGKAFRCKECESRVSVPDDEADGGWDDFGDDDDFVGGSGRGAVSDPYRAPKKRTKKKSRRSRGSESMPSGVMMAVVGIGLLMLFNVFGIVMQGIQGNVAGMSGSAIRLGIEVVIMVGIFNRQTVARWTSVVLSSIALVLFTPCGIAIFFVDVPNMPQELKIILGAVLLGQALIEILIIAGLALPAAEEWFTN